MAFADVGDVEDRIDFELDDKQVRMVDARLEDASEMAKHLSGLRWSDTNAPRVVRTIVLNAVVRWINNPDATVTSRAGDETLVWSDLGEQGSFYFTKQETEALGAFQARPKFGSMQVVAYRDTGLHDHVQYVYTNAEGKGEPYPWLVWRNGVPR